MCIRDRNIDVESILAFFHSEPGRLALDAENIVLREWPFTFALPASELKHTYLLPDTQSCPERSRRDAIRDTIIVQGIVDMLVRTPRGLVIIDFKTDRITAGQVDERAGLYRRQLELYGRAASAILKSECITKWLYFLTPCVSKEV